MSYPIVTILTQSSVRTSYQHREQWWSAPNFKLSSTTSSQVAELQRHATTSNWHEEDPRSFSFSPLTYQKKNSRKNSLPSFAVRYDWLAHWWWAVRNSKFSKLFLCTEIFSKRRKICELWRETWDALMHEISHSFCPMMFLQLNWFFLEMVDFSVSNSSLDWLMITCFMGRIKLFKFFHL